MRAELPIDQLDVVAVIGRPDPDDPLRPLCPVFRPRHEPDVVVWPTRIDDRKVVGVRLDASTLDGAEQEGAVTRLAAPQPARGHAWELVATPAGPRYIERAVRNARETARVQTCLQRAIEAWHAHQREAAMDAFDEAFLTSRLGLVPAVLRAGAASISDDAEWRAACVEDLVRVVDYQGASLSSCKANLMWSRIPHTALLELLLDSARRAYERETEPALALETPVPESLKKIAGALALYRRAHLDWSAQLPTRLATAAVRGEPDALRTIDRMLGASAAWAECKSRATATDTADASDIVSDAVARAELEDMGRFARTLYTLEASAGERDRRSAWQNFCSRTAGIDAIVDAVPWRAAERLADDARQRLGWDGEPIRGLGRFAAEQAGVHIGAMRSFARHDCASAAPRNTPPCVFFARGSAAEVDDQLRYRFAIAHELGHLLVDRQQATGWICSTTDHDRSAAEKRANAFAAYFMAPRHAVRALVPSLPPLGTPNFIAAVARIRERFGLSTVAAAEHILNCHREPGREPLPLALRGELTEKLADESVEIDESDTFVSEPVGPGNPIRRGEYRRLIDDLQRAQLISPIQATDLLGTE